jgi:hypothetical protein
MDRRPTMIKEAFGRATAPVSRYEEGGFLILGRATATIGWVYGS